MLTDEQEKMGRSILANAEVWGHKHTYFRWMFDDIFPEKEWITSDTPEYKDWVRFIEMQFITPRTRDNVFIALALIENRVELPDKYHAAFQRALGKYLVSDMTLEEAFFGFKRKSRYADDWHTDMRYKRYFVAMLLGSLGGNDGASKKLPATKSLNLMILDKDKDAFDNIYRYYHTWKSSEQGQHALNLIMKSQKEYQSQS